MEYGMFALMTPAEFAQFRADVVAGNKIPDPNAVYMVDDMQYVFEQTCGRLIPTGEFTLYQHSVPSGIAPTGTVAANGALTLGTALQQVYSLAFSGGIWLFLPAGAAFAGSPAGSYYCVMTSTTVGTIFNNQLVLPGSTDAPANPVPIVAAGPGAYVGSLAEIDLASVIVPAGIMGADGSFDSYAKWTCQSSGSTKSVKSYFGGTMMQNGTVGAALGRCDYVNCQNRTMASQANGADNSGIGSNAGIALRSSLIDTSLDQIHKITGTLLLATDFIVLDTMRVKVTPT